VCAAPGVRRRPAGRKAMIAAAARKLAAGRGFAAISLDDIAGEVGITPAALYRHFPGKAALAEAVLIDVIDRFSLVADEALAAGAGLRGLTGQTISLALDDPSLLAAYLRENAMTESSDVRDRERRLQQRWTQAIGAATPGLDASRSLIRQRAVLGALSATTTGFALLARPRLDELLSRSCLAVLESPAPATRPDHEHARQDGWRPPASRQDAILDAALELFRRRSFAGTGIDDIGAALGLAGSAIYRSYPSKAHILLDAYDRAGARVAVGAEEALAGADSAQDALFRLALSFATVAIDNVDLIVVTSREGSALPEAERPRLSRRRKAVRDTWMAALRQCRPELAAGEARLLVRGVFPLATEVAQVARRFGVSAAEVSVLMACFALSIRPPSPPSPPGAGARNLGAVR
jgi:AcrR family transcriptional regulator